MADRPQHGARRRCSCEGTGDCKRGVHKPCAQFARRNTVPARCHSCGAGTRAEAVHNADGTKKMRGLVHIPPRVQDLLDGTINVEDLDDEELARGYPRAEDGSFRGRPTVIPTSLHQRIQRELFSRASQQLRESLLGVTETMTSIAQDKEVDPAQRIKAAQWVVERLMGKTPDVSIALDEKKYERVLAELDRGAIVWDVEEDGRQA